jgi:hypothetical protein
VRGRDRRRRKMKKVITIAMAFMLIMAFSVVPSFAAGSFQPPTYEDVQEDSPEDHTIPVYGYVGEDGDLDNGQPPTITTHAINVSVPTHIIWAAFEGDKGEVTSPNYYIKNNSKTLDLNVTIKDFTAEDSEGNNAVDSALTLTLEGKNGEFGTSTTLFDKTEVITGNTDKIDNTFTANTKWEFTIGGLYDSEDFDTPQQPEYSMVLLFEKK